MSGVQMMLNAMGFTPEKIQGMMGELMKAPDAQRFLQIVTEFKDGMNTLNANQRDAEIRAEERHKELLAAIAGETVSAAPDKDRASLDA